MGYENKNSKRETARDLRKKSKRLEKGRDALKEKSKEKSKAIKKLRGNVDDIKESRDSWKNRYQQAEKKIENLTVDIQEHSKQLLEANEKQIKKDRELLKLQKAYSELKKKK